MAGCVKDPWLSVYSSELPRDHCPKVWSLYKQAKFVLSASASVFVSAPHLRIPSAAHPLSDSHSTLYSHFSPCPWFKSCSQERNCH